VQSLPTDVPEVFVDRDLLKQAVLNLVLNAVEAMPGGGQIRLELTRRAEMRKFRLPTRDEESRPKPAKDFSTFLYNPARRQRNRIS